MAKIYKDEVIVKRLLSVFAGPGEEIETLQSLKDSGCALLAAFANDNDIQQIRVTSTNIGFVREYTKMIRRSTANESVPEYLENGCYARDAQLVIDACLAEFLPDDGEAADLEWLAAVGFARNAWGYNAITGPIDVACDGITLCLMHRSDEWVIKNSPTRREVRDLCRVLGVTLKEGEQA